MLRIAAIVIAAYAAGHPALAGMRPELLEKPLAGFHGDVNSVAGRAWQTLVAADNTGVMRSIGHSVGAGSTR